MGKRLLLSVGFWGIVLSACAQTILSGALYRENKFESNPDYTYTLTLNLRVPAAEASLMPNVITFSLYRQSDHALMQEFTATRHIITNTPDFYLHACDPNINSLVHQVVYSISPILKPQAYPSTSGYYFVHTPIGKRVTTSNIASETLVLYHWFSPAFLFDQPDGLAPGKTTTHAAGLYGYGCVGTQRAIDIGVGPGLPRSLSDRISPAPVLEVKFRLVNPLAGAPNGVLQDVAYKSGYALGQYLGGQWRLTPVRRGTPGVFGVGIQQSGSIPVGTFSFAMIYEQYLNGEKISEGTLEHTAVYTYCPKIVPTTVTVSEVGSPGQPASATICTGQAVQLNGGNGQARQQYNWLLEGRIVPGQTDSVLVVDQPGRYQVQIRQSRVCDTTTSAVVTIVSKGDAKTAVVQGDSILCPGRPLSLSASLSPATYQWYRDGQPILGATAIQLPISGPGRYAVRTNDVNGCWVLSTPVTVRAGADVTVRMDTISPICLTGSSPLPLRASPSGGHFTGPGVLGNQFDPQTAGVGRHLIHYQPTGGTGCLLGESQRIIEVRADPPLNLPNRIEQLAATALLYRVILGPPIPICGRLPDFLDDPTKANPIATPTKSQSYQLHVTDPIGCAATDTLRLEVVERVYIPTAFTPNADGTNDTWELRGITEYPTAVVELYNRWGQAVFQSEPGYPRAFDGQAQGNALPTGVYAYRIRLSSDRPILEGALLLVR